jgi:hypothetical protein
MSARPDPRVFEPSAHAVGDFDAQVADLRKLAMLAGPARPVSRRGVVVGRLVDDLPQACAGRYSRSRESRWPSISFHMLAQTHRSKPSTK